jgi:hypothetical protein
VAPITLCLHVWCRRMDKVVIVTRITHLMARNVDICEVQCNIEKAYQFRIDYIDTEVKDI